MSEKVTIEDFDVAMMPKLVGLFASYFPRGDRLLSEGYNSWLYGNNPSGPAKVTIVSEGDIWLGFMALVPIALQRQGGRMSGFFGANVLVHPQHHGKNIFGKMIAAAHEFVSNKDMVLMGHPNKMAIKSWQRAGMAFYEPLQLWWVAPRRLRRGITRTVVKRLDENSTLWSALETQRGQVRSWQTVISADILSWRYLKHPTNIYQLHWMEADGVPVGVQIIKRMRYGISLVIDSFLLEPFAKHAFQGLPWRTLSLRPCMDSAGRPAGHWATPIKKELPFFFTCLSAPFSQLEVTEIGLTASDF